MKPLLVTENKFSLSPSTCNPGSYYYRDYAIVPHLSVWMIDDLCGGSWGFFHTVEAAMVGIDSYIAETAGGMYVVRGNKANDCDTIEQDRFDARA